MLQKQLLARIRDLYAAQWPARVRMLDRYLQGQQLSFLQPVIYDPYLLGRVACCQNLADLYANGVATGITAIYGASLCSAMAPEPGERVRTLALAGYEDCLAEAQCLGLRIAEYANHWPVVGGLCLPDFETADGLRDNAQPGDVIVMTKALGTQVAGEAVRWLREDSESFERIAHLLSAERIEALYERSLEQMATLNARASELMR